MEFVGGSTVHSDLTKYHSKKYVERLQKALYKVAVNCDAESASESIAREIQGLTKSQGYYISLRDRHETSGIYCIACVMSNAYGNAEDIIDDSKSPVGAYFDVIPGALHTDCVTKKKIIICNDPEYLELHNCPFISIHNFIGIPLMSNRNKVIGILALCNRKDPYTEELIRYIRPLINMLEVAVAGFRDRRYIKSFHFKDVNSTSQARTDEDVLNMYYINCLAKIDDAGVIVSMSRSFIEEFSKVLPSARLHAGMLIREFKNGTLHSVYREIRKCMRRGTRTNVKLKFKTISHVAVFQCSFVRVTDYCIFFAKNVSDKYRYKKTLKRLKKEQEQIIKSKNQYLSRISHELRTPLNAIIGFSQLINMAIDNSSEETGFPREYLQYISTSGALLLKLVEDVLDLSKVSSGNVKLSIENVALNELVAECLAMFQEDIRQSEVTVKNEIPNIVVKADYQKIQQVIINLISNAIKYNKPGGSISFSCSVSSDQDCVYIILQDTGIGIIRKNIKYAFQPFNRLGMENSDIEGTGLGLALSRDLMRVMNGDIYVESEEGVGSKFIVKCPMNSSESNLSTISSTSGRLRTYDSWSNERSILYIEDNPSNVKLMQEMIKLAGPIKLHIAMSGERGVELARNIKPELIILDIGLPDISGVQVKSRLQKREETRNIPVIVNSADASKSQIDRMLKMGCVDYITKPVDIGSFLEVIKKHIK